MRIDKYEPKIPNDYEDLYIYIPDADEIVRISEGSGSNLTNQDLEEGVIDYIDYTQYVVCDNFESTDGGMVMLTQYFRDKYSCTAACVEDVFDLAYGNRNIDYVI